MNIESELFLKERESNPDYYKNILPANYYDDFEKVVEIIKNELILFHKNLVYTEKIIDFINLEFKENGVFPTDLYFLILFTENTINSMILTTHKLAFEKADIKNKKNVGLAYLNTLISISIKEFDETSNIKINTRKKLKETKELFRKLEKLEDKENIHLLRNSNIAHIDLSAQENIKTLKIDFDTLSKAYNISVEIFEILSLKFYELENSFSKKMIDIHSFKNHVCQNPWMNNPNPYAKLDIENYFAMLRKNFINNLTLKK